MRYLALRSPFRHAVLTLTDAGVRIEGKAVSNGGIIARVVNGYCLISIGAFTLQNFLHLRFPPRATLFVGIAGLVGCVAPSLLAALLSVWQVPLREEVPWERVVALLMEPDESTAVLIYRGESRPSRSGREVPGSAYALPIRILSPAKGNTIATLRGAFASSIPERVVECAFVYRWNRRRIILAAVAILGLCGAIFLLARYRLH